jgi:hypothetical protein
VTQFLARALNAIAAMPTARQVYECATVTVTVEVVARLPMSETFTQ